MARAAKPLLTPEQIKRLGWRHWQMIRIEPADRPNLNLNGAVNTVAIEYDSQAMQHVITADLPSRLTNCTHCGNANIALHGRYVIHIADLPYVNEEGRAMPVQYKVTAQRYQCFVCNRGDVEPLPDVLRPVLTKARITKRLSEWLLHALQTVSSYDTLAIMTGYSKVWVRKWYTEVKQSIDLRRTPARPGPKRKAAEAADAPAAPPPAPAPMATPKKAARKKTAAKRRT